VAIRFKKPVWLMSLISLPFVGFGLGLFLMSILPTLYLGVTVPSWNQVPARIETTSLDTSYGDSTTYLAKAQYRYTVDGQTYVSHNVGFSTSKDNVGHWQQSTYAELKKAKDSNEPITAFVNPDDPQKAYLFPDVRWGLLAFKMIFVVVFGGIGSALFFASFITIDRKSSALKTTGYTYSDTTASSQLIYSSARLVFWFYFSISLLIAAVSSPALIDLNDEWRSGNHLILLALVFPVFAIGFFIAAVKEGLRILKFGRSPLQLKPFPAAIGGHIGATVLVNTAADSDHRYRVVISCIHRYTRRSGGKTRTKETVHWYDEGLAYVERASHNKTNLRFAFNIPPNLPETTESSSDYYFWRLDIDAVVSRSVFRRSFRVPVKRVTGAVPTKQFLATEHPQLGAVINERISSLQIQDNRDAVTVFTPRFSLVLERLSGVLFGGVFLASGIGVWLGGAPFIFPLFFVPVGSLFVLGGLRSLFTSVNVTVDGNGIKRQSSLLGLPEKNVVIASTDIAQLTVQKASSWEFGQAQKKNLYAISAKGKTNTKIQLIERIEGKDAAEKLRQRFQELLRLNP